ncbi:hypothetical protein OCK74_00995 [Chitinophagaceae bacterium LB-8]|uniref:Uncharacterized protein n=1 Tax=Paraflavisolibacter caeni TaxID=2982496 RepID=A0A9X2XMR5_9BACT|nr:hypothetical protein [Paraflavisolibacter caeni]MCU7547663.1 hypothetical protein [Paraflavisolibacter caeni]
MENNKDRLKEQDAPLKNTDRAFVKVNRDGTPGLPQTAENNDDRKQKEADLEQQRKEALTERD